MGVCVLFYPQFDLINIFSETEPEPVSSKLASIHNLRPYSVQALVMLAELTATLLDVVYRSEEKERVVPLLNSIMHNVFPYLRNHR